MELFYIAEMYAVMQPYIYSDRIYGKHKQLEES